VVRAAVAAALLLPPTVAMGGTWPAVVRHAARTTDVIGRRASGLYAVNAGGAVVGALAMAYLLLPSLGLLGSLMLLALGNGALGLTALWIARTDGIAGAEPAGAAEAVPAAAPAARRGLVAGVLLIAGFLSFAHETAWIRLFSVVLGSSVYSFAVMVASFVAGIALGGALLAWLDHRIRRPLALLAWSQLAAGAFVLLALPAGQYLPWLFGRLADRLSRPTGSFAVHETAKALACATVLLPLAVLVGMSLPLAVKAVARRPEALGHDAGRLYAVNTMGNVAGALVTGLVLLPWLGLQRLLLATALAGVTLGLTLLWRLPASRRSRVGAASCAAACAAWAVALGGWNPAWFTLAPTRARMPTFARASEYVLAWDVLFERDDPAAHVMVAEVRDARPRYRVLFVNGKADASSGGDMPTQLLLAHLPLVLHPHARDVAVIGLASGVTAGAALAHPIERLEVIDIAAATARASDLFAEWNRAPLADPRTRLFVDDGRSRLLHGTSLHDVIVSEPSNPWVAGVGALFSRELYAAASRRLAPGGCFVQWLQAYEQSDGLLAAVVRTFRVAFPHVRAFQGAGEDLILVGWPDPPRLDWDAAARRVLLPAVARDLELAGSPTLDDLLAREVLSPPSIDYLASTVGVENTDDNLLLEHRAPRDRLARATPTVVRRLDERPLASPSLLRSRRSRPPEPAPAEVPTPQSAGEVLASPDARRVTSWLALHAPRPPSAEAAVLRACRLDPGEPCDAVLAFELSRRPSPTLQRLQALRTTGRAGGPSGP
jgi:predicted membrane-bound spermidine synthase